MPLGGGVRPGILPLRSGQTGFILFSPQNLKKNVEVLGRSRSEAGISGISYPIRWRRCLFWCLVLVVVVVVVVVFVVIELKLVGVRCVQLITRGGENKHFFFFFWKDKPTRNF